MVIDGAPTFPYLRLAFTILDTLKGIFLFLMPSVRTESLVGSFSILTTLQSIDFNEQLNFSQTTEPQFFPNRKNNCSRSNTYCISYPTYLYYFEN